MRRFRPLRSSLHLCHDPCLQRTPTALPNEYLEGKTRFAAAMHRIALSSARLKHES